MLKHSSLHSEFKIFDGSVSATEMNVKKMNGISLQQYNLTLQITIQYYSTNDELRDK